MFTGGKKIKKRQGLHSFLHTLNPALELNKPRLHPFLDITPIAPVLHLRTSAQLSIRRQEENECLVRLS